MLPFRSKSSFVVCLLFACSSRGSVVGSATPGNDGGAAPMPDAGGVGESAGESGAGGRVVSANCTPGADQSCNDNPAISSLHGICRADGTCECRAGYSLNTETGKCR